MLSEQEKNLLAQAEAKAQQNAGCALEKYLKPEFREKIKDHPSRAAWAIHFHEALSKQQETPSVLEMSLLDEAFRMADAAVAYDQFGAQAFDNEKYLNARKLGADFSQLLQRYRLRLNDPSIKTIVLKMAHELCAA